MNERRTVPGVESILGTPVPETADSRRDPPLAVRLPPGMRDELRETADRRGLTPNALAVRGIRRELDDPQPKEETTDGRTP